MLSLKCAQTTSDTPSWTIRLINNILSGSDVDMSYKDRLDQHSELFHHNWTRPKRSKSQVNGHTEMSQTNIILRSNAKAHRW